MISYIIQFHVILFGGLFISFVIHEYLHIRFLRNARRDGHVEIEFTLTRISIYPKFELTPREIVRVAIIPIIILPIIGLALILLAQFIHQRFLMFTGYVYVFHVINIIPPLGDGMMIIKAILNKKSSMGGG
ncbi:metalloprotease family protein [Lentibacillus saliphilus]|uniref:metalloprotease family protein n=1 Tax=Lentibacillus saliphilus TaxID=2737028 RepID=UPI003CCE686D